MSWVCDCCFIYPAFNAHAPYYIVICGLTGCTIFVHIISPTARFSKKKILSMKYVFWFSLQLLSETSHPKENSATYYRKYTVSFIKRVLFLSCQIFNETWISSTDFRKMLVYKLSWKSFQWDASFSIRMNRRTETVLKKPWRSRSQVGERT